MNGQEYPKKKFSMMTLVGLLLILLACASSASPPSSLDENSLPACEECKGNASIDIDDYGVSNVTDPVLASSAKNDLLNPEMSSEISLGVAPINSTSRYFPGKATLVSPKLTAGTSKPTYIWNPVAGGTEYRLKVVNINNQNHPVIDQWYNSVEVLSNSRCSIEPDVALAPGTYKWWIQTRDYKGYGPWSNYMSFRLVNILPGKATLVSPKLTVGTSKPTYVWNPVAGSTEYRLKVANINNLNYPVIDMWNDSVEVLSNSRCSIKPNVALDPGVTYKWWIQTRNSMGDGPWSNYMSFRLTNTLPGRANPISPRGLISSSTPTFTWAAVQTATNYYLQVADDNEDIVDEIYYAEDVTSGTRCSAHLPISLPDGIYYWRIMAANDAGNGTWSSYRYFETICSSEMPLAKARVQKADGSVDRGAVKPPRSTSQKSCSACKARSH
jgi:hypothetical protein